MFREQKARALTETIDGAMDQAEDLGLTFVAGILMMARLETVQTEQPGVAKPQEQAIVLTARPAASRLPAAYAVRGCAWPRHQTKNAIVTATASENRMTAYCR